MSPLALVRKTDEAESMLEQPAEAGFDLPRIERAVREILCAVGENPDRDGLRETPRRVARAYAEMLCGLRQDAEPHLQRVFEHRSDPDDLVLV